MVQISLTNDGWPRLPGIPAVFLEVNVSKTSGKDELEQKSACGQANKEQRH